MYPVFVAALFLLLAGALSTAAMLIDSTTKVGEGERVRADQARIAEGIDRYVTENGHAPSSMAELLATDGYQQLQSHVGPWQRYERSGTLNDGTWQFQRAVSWTVHRKDGADSYRAENACGNGDLQTAASWCGPNDGIWYRTESREVFAEELTQQRVRQQRTLQLLGDKWSASQAFPNVGRNGDVINVGQLRTLAELTGYTGQSSNCTGVHVWAQIPFDCAALFDIWGGAVGYQFQGPNYVLLISQAPIRSASGAPVLVASPLQVQE